MWAGCKNLTCFTGILLRHQDFSTVGITLAAMEGCCVEDGSSINFFPYVKERKMCDSVMIELSIGLGIY